MSTILPQSAGYGVVLGVGFFFTTVMAMISFIQVHRLHSWDNIANLTFFRIDIRVSH